MGGVEDCEGKRAIVGDWAKDGQRDVWACCLTFGKGKSNNVHGSWWMQQLVGAGVEAREGRRRRDDQPRGPGI